MDMPTTPGMHRCPLHKDSRESLSIFVGDDGLLRWKCHAGCGSGKVQGAGSHIPVPKPKTDWAEEFRIERYLGAFDVPTEEACNHRKIDGMTCVEYYIRYYDPNKRWFIPIRDASGVMRGIKWHTDMPEARQKCGWVTIDPDKKKGINTLFPRPEVFDPRRIMYICPGELKALRLISLGEQSVSPTSGESFRWPRREVKRLRWFRCCVIWDNDPAGIRFRDATLAALAAEGIPCGQTTCGEHRECESFEIGKPCRPGGTGLRSSGATAAGGE